jgi:hypothetical protein
MINHLAHLLEKFKGLRNPKEERVKIASVITQTLGFEISEDQVSLKKGTLSINADNYLKGEIFMQKDLLLEALKKENLEVFDIK